MTNLQSQLKDLMLNQLIGEDIFNEAYNLREEFERKEFDSNSKECKLLSKVIDLNIKIHKLHNDSYDLLKKLETLTK